MISRALLVLALAGCNGGDDEGATEAFDEAGGLLGQGMVNPFPSAHLVGDDGKLALTAEMFPPAPGPFPGHLASYRTGFSPAQVATLRLPGLDCSTCPPWKNPTPGEGGVLLVDLTAGEFLPVMAELDAFEDAVDPTLLIRPQIGMPYDHRVAVVVTTDVVARPERFAKLFDGTFDTPWSEHYGALVDQLQGLGVAADRIALAWDFPIGDGTAPTRSAVRQVEATGNFDIGLVQRADLGDDTPAGIWRRSYGSFEVTDFVDGEGLLDMDTATGEVRPVGITNVKLAVAIPESVRDAPAGSVPVLIYGHGLLDSPELSLWGASNMWGPMEVASELGMIVVATPWGGLDADSFLTAVGVANDLAKFPTLSAAMIQGQANHAAMLQLIRSGALGADPLFTGDSGQQLLDTEHIYFNGISMGGILGPVLMAQEGADIDAGVLQVGGSMWSSLLERSSAWGMFEMMVTDAVIDPADRQLFYSASQLFWDPVDPIAYAPDLGDEIILLQESVADDTVHNMTTRALARSIGLPVLDPSVDGPFGLSPEPADLPVGSHAYVQFDSGADAPPNKNRPAPETGSHVRILGWWEVEDQVKAFLTPGAEGQVLHYCGADACSSTNRGAR